MRQVLFHIPVPGTDVNIPIYGYGFMLFVAFVFCVWLAARHAKKEGIDPKHVQDLAIWLFLTGIAGARLTFMIQYGVPLAQFFMVWDGGLVFYGSAIGGAIGYFLAYWFILRKHNISSWKMADIIAPGVALGLCLGRLGCLLNGCCYGGVACPDCPGISFPLASPPRYDMVARGWQTTAGFTVADDLPVVTAVEPHSNAAKAGLKVHDRIIQVNGHDAMTAFDLDMNFGAREWPRGKNDVQLTVRRGAEEIALPPYVGWTIRLNPTQLYETISMGLLFFLLLSYLPFRKRDGSVMVLLMLCYPVHRFFNEMLRDDTKPVAFGMTLSQNISLLLLTAGILLGIVVALRKPRQPLPGALPETGAADLQGTTAPGSTAIQA